MPPSIEKLLLAAASSLDDASDRRTFLDHACENDPSLRKRLNELLDLRTEADGFFEFQPALRANGNASGGAEEIWTWTSVVTG